MPSVPSQSRLQQAVEDITRLLHKQQLLDQLAQGQEGPRRELVEQLQHRQNIAEMEKHHPQFGSARAVVRKSEHGWFTDFDPAPIHKRTAIDDRPVLLGTPFGETVDSIKLEREHTAFRGMDLRHAGCRIVKVGHAVDPCIRLWGSGGIACGRRSSDI